MFSTYDLNNLPKVSVTFGEKVKDDEDFDNFLNGWRDLNDKKEFFYFIMDTEKTGYVPLKYCFKMSSFINKIRQENKRYLRFSIIYVSNKIVSYLLKIIFKFSPPIAPLFIVNSKEEICKLENILKKTYFTKNNITPSINHKNMKKSLKYIYVKPA